MEKKTFMQKLKNMGPAAIITSAFIGPGTITTATLVGVKFQYALLWAVVFSGIALIVLMEMSSRIAIASHKNVIDAAIALKPESRGWRLFIQIFVGLAVGISCFAFQSGNEIGASAGLQDITGMPQWVSALIIGVIALIAALASNKVLETIMQVFVSVMGTSSCTPSPLRASTLPLRSCPMPVLTFVSTSLSVLSSLLLSLSLVALCCMGPALPSMAP